MAKKRPKLSDQIRRAIMEAPLTRYRIAKVTGIDQAVLSRFVAGKVGLSMATLDALADALGLDIVARKATGQEKRIRKGR